MAHSAAGTRVVVVDDSLYMRHVLRRILEDFGWDVVGEAENGRQAIELVTSLHPDLVTMDITMPGMNGLEATRQLARVAPGVCVVMCSAVGQADMIVEAIRAGAKGFIAKPFRSERVGPALMEALQGRAVAV